jgi:hypothetical protein
MRSPLCNKRCTAVRGEWKLQMTDRTFLELAVVGRNDPCHVFLPLLRTTSKGALVTPQVFSLGIQDVQMGRRRAGVVHWDPDTTRRLGEPVDPSLTPYRVIRRHVGLPPSAVASGTSHFLLADDSEIEAARTREPA